MAKRIIKCYVTEEQYQLFRNAADLTHRTMSQFLVEAGDQYVKRYLQKRSDSIEKRFRELKKDLEEMYDTVLLSDRSK